MDVSQIILCKDGICPICKSKLETRTYEGSINEDVFCPNRCYFIMYMGEELHKAVISIFGSYTGVFPDGGNKDIEKIVKSVLYWRDNERYLIKILEDT